MNYAYLCFGFVMNDYNINKITMVDLILCSCLL